LRALLGENRVRLGRNSTAVTHGACALLLVSALALSAAPVSSFARPAAMRMQSAPAATTVIDEAGRRVEIPARVNRIVTLSPDLTETIYALGLEEKLVGDTNYCDKPAAAKLKPHVGSPKTPSLEAIAALRPDVVLASTSINRVETADALARLGFAVYTTNPQTVRGVLKSITDVADVLGAGEKGQAVVAGLQARLDGLGMKLADLPPAHVLFVVWEDPLITVGQNTFIADALRFAGAESVILAEQSWPQISFEEVVRLQPDYIVFTSNHSGDSDALLARLRKGEAWKGLHAVEMGHVVTISDEIARPSVGLVNAIEELARDVHPEAFSSSGARVAPGAKNREQAGNVRDCREELAACAR
jgi:iron complex transport system substrate-binding protein